jgi:DNA-directed RNA polymerase specialized sigma24 family protein
MTGGPGATRIPATAILRTPARRVAHELRVRTECRSPVMSRRGKPAQSAGSEVRTLDHRLYAWLLEADERRFERAFSGYFAVAFPAVVRYLARLSRWDLVQLEELAQDALLKFFDRVGRRRREASEAVAHALVRIRPLDLGPFHERQVQGWTKDVSSFRDAAMSFRLSPSGEADDENWKAEIRALGDRIPVLQRQGCYLLHAVQLELHWGFESEDLKQVTVETEHHPAVDPLDEPIHVEEQISVRATLGIAESLAREVRSKTARALTAEEHHPGVLHFIDGTFTVVAAIPRLRVPTNGYLFEIAMTLYLDECKKRGRQKRGGCKLLAGGESGPDAESAQPHPLESISLDSTIDLDHEDRLDGIRRIPLVDASGAFIPPASDPTSRYEDEEFLERFYAYLRKPLKEAIEAYEQARTGGRAVAEQRKLESIAKKFERTIGVLSLMGEGYTQEETASRLGLSRNQVKYVIEIVQEAYMRFAPDTRLPTRSSSLRN